MIGFGFGPSLTTGAPPRAGFDFTAGVLPPGAHLTRASAGSRFDAAGVLTIEPADTARFDHDPATGARLGLLIEPERTNDAAASAAFDDAAWSNIGATVEMDGGIAPDATPTAAAIADALPDGYASLTQMLPTTAPRTLSAFVAKDETGRSTRFPLLRGAATSADLMIDTATGAFALLGAGTDGSVRDCGSFWRLSFRSEACSLIRLYPAAGAGAAWPVSTNVTGSTVMWGVQAEQGAGATSYIPTTAAPATRAADVLTLDWGRFGIADGPIGVRYLFDDDTAQDGTATVTGGRAAVPTDLARPWIRRIERRQVSQITF